MNDDDSCCIDETNFAEEGFDRQRSGRGQCIYESRYRLHSQPCDAFTSSGDLHIAIHGHAPANNTSRTRRDRQIRTRTTRFRAHDSVFIDCQPSAQPSGLAGNGRTTDDQFWKLTADADDLKLGTATLRVQARRWGIRMCQGKKLIGRAVMSSHQCAMLRAPCFVELRARSNVSTANSCYISSFSSARSAAPKEKRRRQTCSSVVRIQ